MEKKFQLEGIDLDYDIYDLVNGILNGSKNIKKKAVLCIIENANDQQFLNELVKVSFQILDIPKVDMISAYGKSKVNDRKLNTRV